MCDFRQLHPHPGPQHSKFISAQTFNPNICAFYRSILKILQSRHFAPLCTVPIQDTSIRAPKKLYKLEHSLKGRDRRIAQPIPVARKGEKQARPQGTQMCVCVCMNDHQPTLDTTMLHQNREPSIKTLTDVKRSLRIGAHPSQLAMCWAPSLVLLLLLQSPTTSVLLRHNAACIATCNVCDSCTFASFVRTLHWGLGFRV